MFHAAAVGPVGRRNLQAAPHRHSIAFPLLRHCYSIGKKATGSIFGRFHGLRAYPDNLLLYYMYLVFYFFSLLFLLPQLPLLLSTCACNFNLQSPVVFPLIAYRLVNQ